MALAALPHRSLSSCLYRGTLHHRRHAPVAHAFRYRVHLVYLDLDELDRVFAGSWIYSARRPALAWFRRRDHFGAPEQPLADAVRDHVERIAGTRPRGPIRLLTHLRYCGYCFNPVSFFYCFDRRDRALESVLAEVGNTPWGERHLYLLERETPGDSGDEAPCALRFRHRKSFHVSPFQPMDLDYVWSFSLPAKKLGVHVALEQGPTRSFDATLELERLPLTPHTLRAVFLRQPLMTVKVLAAIYWQAALLRLRGATFHPHPRTTAATGTAARRDP